MRVALFIDGKNFYSGWKDAANGERIDFNRLAEWLVKEVGGDRLAAAHYYTGIEDADNELAETQGKLGKFLSFIKTQRGFFVHSFKRRQVSFGCPHCNNAICFTREKEVDTSMVADMVRLAAVNAYDVAILLSGDADYIPAIQSVAQLGKQAWIASWGGSGLAARIKDVAFDHIDLLTGLDFFQCKDDARTTPAVGGEFGRLKLHSLSQSEDVGSGQELVFLQELRKAQDHFSKSRPGSTGGYVGLGYFLTKWRSSALTSDAELRRQVLDSLVEQGKVDVYTASDGYQALSVAGSGNPEDPYTCLGDDDDEEDEPYGHMVDRLTVKG
jgi:uncharacterized LabA/DUF88 family protein